MPMGDGITQMPAPLCGAHSSLLRRQRSTCLLSTAGPRLPWDVGSVLRGDSLPLTTTVTHGRQCDTLCIFLLLLSALLGQNGF